MTTPHYHGFECIYCGRVFSAPAAADACCASIADPLAACARALDQLAVVAGTAIIPAAEDPRNERVLEVTTDPSVCGETVPDRLLRSITDPATPWGGDVGVLEAGPRSGVDGHHRVLVVER